MKKYLLVLMPLLMALSVMTAGCSKSVQMNNEVEETLPVDVKSDEEPFAEENGEDGEEQQSATVKIEDDEELQPSEENGGVECDDCDFCQVFDIENPVKSIPVINMFLSGLPENLNGEQKIDELEKWLNIQSCVISAQIQHYSAVKTNPPTGEVHVRFGSSSTYRFYVMDISWTQPLTVTGFHDIWYHHENTVEPIIIPSNEYLLEGNCSWVVPESFTPQFNLVVINSDDELIKYITCAEEGKVYPAIDFTKHTILFVHGVNPGTQSIDSIDLHRFPDGSYVLNCGLRGSLASVITYLKAAVIIDKFDERGSIELKLNVLR